MERVENRVKWVKITDIHPLDFWDFNFCDVNHLKTSRFLVPSVGVVEKGVETGKNIEIRHDRNF